MSYYRISLQFNAAPDADSAPLNFTAWVEAASVLAAKQEGVSSFRELALTTGLQLQDQPKEIQFESEEVDNRSSGLLQISSLEVQPGVFCMTMTGPLETATALQLDKETYLIEHMNAHTLIIELGRVHPMGSAGLGVLLNLNDRLKVILVRVPVRARKMMGILGLEESLTIRDSFPEALEHIDS